MLNILICIMILASTVAKNFLNYVKIVKIYVYLFSFLYYLFSSSFPKLLHLDEFSYLITSSYTPSTAQSFARMTHEPVQRPSCE